MTKDINSKDNLNKKSDSRTSKRFDNAEQRGFFIRRGKEDVPMTEGGNFQPISFYWTVKDRKAGSTSMEPIMRAESNLNIIQMNATSLSVREELAKFFLSRKLRVIMRDQIPRMSRIIVGNKVFLTDSLVEAVASSKMSSEACMVVQELIFPALHSLGMIVDTREYTFRVIYPPVSVTAEALARDVAMEEIVRVARGLQVDKILKTGDTYTPDGFVHAFAEAFVCIGAKILETNELGSIVDDMVRGVRAHIDPLLTGLTGMVPASWAKHTVITELATCYPFIIAALSLPAGSSVGIRNESSKLNDWAPAVLAALKSSQRYAFISAAALISDWNKVTLSDVKGGPKTVVMHRSAVPHATAQAIYSEEDDFVKGGVTVYGSKSLIDQALTAAYSDTAKFGTDAAVKHLVTSLQDLIDSGFIPTQKAYFYDVGYDSSLTAFEMACLLAKEVELDFSRIDAKDSFFDPSSSSQRNWRFIVDTKFKWGEFGPDYPMSGRFTAAGEFITCDALESLMMSADFKAKDNMLPRPQLIDRAAFQTCILGFEPERETVSIVDKVSYAATVGSVSVHGSLAFNSIGSLQSPKNVRMVVPVFNQHVFDCVSSVWRDLVDLISYFKIDANRLPSSTATDRVVDHVYMEVAMMTREIAEGISLSLRQLIHDKIERDCTANLPSDKSLAMQAKLAQTHLIAYVDLVALDFFLNIQGMDNLVVKGTLDDEKIMNGLLLIGSQRKPRV